MIPHEFFFTNSPPSATIIHMKTKTISSARYNLIDVIRAVAIISMIAYHLCYDIFVVFEVDPSFDKYTLTLLWERSICFTFIIISGGKADVEIYGNTQAALAPAAATEAENGG